MSNDEPTLYIFQHDCDKMLMLSAFGKYGKQNTVICQTIITATNKQKQQYVYYMYCFIRFFILSTHIIYVQKHLLFVIRY